MGDKLSEIGGRLDYPRLNKELSQEIEKLWKDPAIQVLVAFGCFSMVVQIAVICYGFITRVYSLTGAVPMCLLQETYSRGCELQLPDCANYFMDHLKRLSDINYIPTKVWRLLYFLSFHPFLVEVTY